MVTVKIKGIASYRINDKVNVTIKCKRIPAPTVFSYYFAIW